MALLWHGCSVLLTGAECLTSMHTGSASAFLCEVIKLQPLAWSACLTNINTTIAASAKPSHVPGNRSCVGVSFGRIPHCCHCDIFDAVSSCRSQGGALSTGLCSVYDVECSSHRPIIAMIKFTGRTRKLKRACHSPACRFVGTPKTMSSSRKKYMPKLSTAVPQANILRYMMVRTCTTHIRACTAMLALRRE